MKVSLMPALAIIITLTCSISCCNETGYRIIDGTIVYPTPDRPEDQIPMIGFAAEPIDTVRVGFIGLGMRGPGAVDRMSHIDGVKTVAICDLYHEKLEPVQKILEERGKPRAAEYSGESGWKELCEREDIDLPIEEHLIVELYSK